MGCVFSFDVGRRLRVGPSQTSRPGRNGCKGTIRREWKFQKTKRSGSVVRQRECRTVPKNGEIGYVYTVITGHRPACYFFLFQNEVTTLFIHIQGIKRHL